MLKEKKTKKFDKGYLPKPALNVLIGEILGVLHPRLGTKKQFLLLLLLVIISTDNFCTLKIEQRPY